MCPRASPIGSHVPLDCAARAGDIRRMRFPFVPLLSLGLAGCSYLPWTKPAPPPPPPAAPVEPSRPLPYPVFESKAFARAVAKGTRTRTGQPGPKYWQQFATYRIDAEFV